MRFDPALVPARLVAREKRFVAHVVLADGTAVTAHCPNSGSMRTSFAEGWEARLSPADSPARKLKWTLEMVHNGRCWIGVHTHLANRLAEEAVQAGTVPELAGYDSIRREVRYGASSRFDLLLERGADRCWVEVKNVTLVDDTGRYAFPDAVTVRGLKHLEELTRLVEAGDRAAMLYVIQRSDGDGFAPAAVIDPEYAAGLSRAAAAGVEVYAYRADVSPEEIRLTTPEPVHL